MPNQTDAHKSPPPAIWRWAVLIAISLAMFGNYYAYDAIGPVADALQRLLGFTDTQIGTLNAIYSFPNIIMVLIGGIIVDRFGTRLSTLMLGAGLLNDANGAGPDNPVGYRPMLWMFALISLFGFVFAAALRQRETGPQGHGLESIRAGTEEQVRAAAGS
jgi:MFS family permease